VKRRRLTRRKKDAVIERDGQCIKCGDAWGPFEVDHVDPHWFAGCDDPDNLQTLCVPCHKVKTAADKKRIGKAKRQARKLGVSRETIRMRPRQKIHNRPWGSTWRRKMNGQVVPKIGKVTMS